MTKQELNLFLDDGEDTLGYYDGEGKIYYVNDEDKLNTIFHELGHYFFMKFGLSEEEFVAEAFANYVCSLFKQFKISSI